MISSPLSKKVFYGLAAVFTTCVLLFAGCKMNTDDDTGSTTTVPGTPAGITATAQTTSSVLVTWTAATSASGYYVYASTSESGTYTKANTISTSATLKAVVSTADGSTALSAGTAYYFKVSAYNSAGEGDKSAAATATTIAASTTVPDAPAGVAAATESASSVVVTWTASSTANGYYVYYSTDSTSFTDYETVSGNTTVTDTVTGLTAATTYYFCVKAYNDKGSSDASSTASATTNDASSRDITSTSADEIANTTFANTIYLNLNGPSYSIDGSSYTTIPTDTAGTITDNITSLNTSGVISIDASSSTGATNFIVSGTISTGSLSIASNKKKAIEICLNGATITSGNYPCIEVTAASRTFIVLADGTTNKLTDGRTYGYGYGTDYATTSVNYVASGKDTKGTLYSKGMMLFSGSGSLTITTAYKHCIYSKDYIRMFSGTITTTNTGRNAIQSVNGFIMEDGTLSLTGTGTHTANQSRGIVVEGDDGSDYPGEGYIIINGGTITSKTVSKGMTAKWDIDEDYDGYDTGTANDTTDDPNPYVKITGGAISVTTTGTPADDYSTTYTDADGVSVTETVNLSPEGIEGKQAVYITGGSITCNTTDDCINASRSTYGEIVISGGEIYAYSSDNDAIDSNGTLTISGGTIVALTKTTPECAFDCDDNTFTITGGTFVGIGTSNYSAPTTSACTQNSIVLGSTYYTAGSTIALKNGSTTAFAFDIPSGYGSSGMVMVLSSPNIASSTEYTIYNGATVSSYTSKFNGLYLGTLTSSGGTAQSTTLTTSSKVTTLSTSSNNGAQEGPGGQR
jgi:hypothetical protein